MASTKSLDDAPPPETIEVSLFGPGYGESCLIHLGWNDWMIVDSCRDQRSGVNPVLDYLDRIGVDPVNSVKLIAASHAHDDHIAGLSQIVERCENAAFICSGALVKDQFFALLEFDEALAGMTRHSAYSEFRKINDILQSRASARGRWPAYQWAVADRPMYRRSADDARFEVQVTSLSPSDEAITRSVAYFASLSPVEGQQPKRIATVDPNTLTCAIWVDTGPTSILLGGDLECGPGAGCGWNAVLSSPFRPNRSASVFKVPHHGSSNAHHPEVWANMLTKEPLALLTPYRLGRYRLPTEDDRRRICAITDTAYITSRLKAPSQSTRVRKASAQLAGTARNVRQEGLAGHVRARLAGDYTHWSVELAFPARHLCRD